MQESEKGKERDREQERTLRGNIRSQEENLEVEDRDGTLIVVVVVLTVKRMPSSSRGPPGVSKMW